MNILAKIFNDSLVTTGFWNFYFGPPMLVGVGPIRSLPFFILLFSLPVGLVDLSGDGEVHCISLSYHTILTLLSLFIFHIMIDNKDI